MPFADKPFAPGKAPDCRQRLTPIPDHQSQALHTHAALTFCPDHQRRAGHIGIIVGTDAALVIDTGLGPASGERVLDLARRIADSRCLLLTVTHFHPEHGYGAQVFQPDATIIYNRVQRDELEEKDARYLDLFRQTQSKAAVDALDGTRIVMPHSVYDGHRLQRDTTDGRCATRADGRLGRLEGGRSPTVG